LAGVRITLAPAYRPPFEVQALVLEEDTYLVLSSTPEVREPREHRLRTLTEGFLAQPKAPGSVVVKQGEPIRLLAIVHDLGAEPTCRQEWVEEALRGSFEQARQLEVRHLGVPILGRVHGQLGLGAFARLLRDALGELGTGDLERVWLVTPCELEAEMRRQLWPE
jgi:hypothetical protein